MSGHGKITFVARCSEPSTGRDVIRLETDWPRKNRAVYILPRDHLPEVGEMIEWTTRRVLWRGQGLRKIGYAFDPDRHSLS